MCVLAHKPEVSDLNTVFNQKQSPKVFGRRLLTQHGLIVNKELVL